ncbi:MAG: hypothetical protein GY754_25985 [bacterium]|nr:hypothetical protein [bacterium]
MKIDAKTRVTDALQSSKEVVKVFKKYDLYCPACKGADEDTIKIVAHHHALNLEEFLSELNGAPDS